MDRNRIDPNFSSSHERIDPEATVNSKQASLDRLKEQLGRKIDDARFFVFAAVVPDPKGSGRLLVTSSSMSKMGLSACAAAANARTLMEMTSQRMLLEALREHDRGNCGCKNKEDSSE